MRTSEGREEEACFRLSNFVGLRLLVLDSGCWICGDETGLQAFPCWHLQTAELAGKVRRAAEALKDGFQVSSPQLDRRAAAQPLHSHVQSERLKQQLLHRRRVGSRITAAGRCQPRGSRSARWHRPTKIRRVFPPRDEHVFIKRFRVKAEYSSILTGCVMSGLLSTSCQKTN